MAPAKGGGRERRVPGLYAVPLGAPAPPQWSGLCSPGVRERERTPRTGRVGGGLVQGARMPEGGPCAPTPHGTRGVRVMVMPRAVRCPPSPVQSPQRTVCPARLRPRGVRSSALAPPAAFEAYPLPRRRAASPPPPPKKKARLGCALVPGRRATAPERSGGGLAHCAPRPRRPRPRHARGLQRSRCRRRLRSGRRRPVLAVLGALMAVLSPECPPPPPQWPPLAPPPARRH